MPPPSDSNGDHSPRPPEWQGMPWVANMNDDLQYAYANQMNANADHRREETKTLRTQNKWQRLWLQIVGLGIHVGIFTIGLVVGALFL